MEIYFLRTLPDDPVRVGGQSWIRWRGGFALGGDGRVRGCRGCSGRAEVEAFDELIDEFDETPWHRAAPLEHLTSHYKEHDKPHQPETRARKTKSTRGVSLYTVLRRNEGTPSKIENTRPVRRSTVDGQEAHRRRGWGAGQGCWFRSASCN